VGSVGLSGGAMGQMLQRGTEKLALRQAKKRARRERAVARLAGSARWSARRPRSSAARRGFRTREQ